ncbi:hypothetical protein [Streptomyces sp. NPDC004135]
MSLTSPDAKAVVAAVDRLTTQVKRLADAPSSGTCDASTLGVGSRHLGPCVLRDGHDGPVHRGPEGETWATVVATADDAPTTPDDGVRYRLTQARKAAALHRRGLISDSELNAVIDAETPAADEDAQHIARRRNSIINLLDRLDRHGTLTPEERALLRNHVVDEGLEHDTARAVAAGNKRHVQTIVPELDDMQTRITKARALHASHASGSPECTQRCERAHPDVRVCNGCGWTAPCPTARALDGTEQPTTEEN